MDPIIVCQAARMLIHHPMNARHGVSGAGCCEAGRNASCEQRAAGFGVCDVKGEIGDGS